MSLHNQIAGRWLPEDELMAQAPQSALAAHSEAKQAIEGINQENVGALVNLRKKLKGLGKELKQWATTLKTEKGDKELQYSVRHTRSELKTLLETVDSRISFVERQAKVQPIAPEALKDAPIDLFGFNFLRICYHMQDGTMPEGAARNNSGLKCISPIVLGEKLRFKDNRGNELSTIDSVTEVRIDKKIAYVTLGKPFDNQFFSVALK